MPLAVTYTADDVVYVYTYAALVLQGIASFLRFYG